MAFLAARPMEDFFVHPILDVESSLSATEKFINEFRLYDAFPQPKQAMTSLQPSASSRPYLSQQTDYFHGYASEEEVASPNAVDDEFSLPSDESYADEITPGTYIAEAIQQCSRAQAVRIHPVGKPRVIDLPKLDLSYRRTSRPSTSFIESRRGSRLQSIEESQSIRSSQESHSRNVSSGSSTANSPASTAPSSVDEEEMAERYNKKPQSYARHKPLMEAAKDITPIEGYIIPKSATLPYDRRSFNPAIRNSIDMSDRYNVPSSPTGSFRPSIRKMGKFSSIINLNILGRDSKDGHDAQSLYSRDSDVLSISSKTSPRDMPSRTHRMVARGANERAPTMQLPTFPGE